MTVHTGSGTGTIHLDVIANGTIMDGVGNPLASDFTAGEIYTIDKTAPSVLSITRASANPTKATTVNFTVAFSESVTGVDTSDFSLTTTGISGAFVSFVSSVGGSGNFYTVAVRTGSGDGTSRLNVIVNGTILDGVSNPLSENFTGTDEYTIDKTSPTVLSVLRASANPTSDAHVSYTAHIPNL